MSEEKNGTNLYFFGFCGDSPFWDPRISWHTATPSLSLCFVDVISAWAPSLFLICSLVIRPRLLTLKKTRADHPSSRRSTAVYVAQQFFNAVVLLATLIDLAVRIHAQYSSTRARDVPTFFYSTAPLVDDAMLIASISLVIVLTGMSRFDGPFRAATFSVVFFFWLLHFFSHLLPFQHYLICSLHPRLFSFPELEKKIALTVFVSTAGSLSALTLCCFARNDGCC